jgi:hypothetical protein
VRRKAVAASSMLIVCSATSILSCLTVPLRDILSLFKDSVLVMGCDATLLYNYAV